MAETTTVTLTEFLLARIAEDEAGVAKPLVDAPVAKTYHPTEPHGYGWKLAHSRIEVVGNAEAAATIPDPARVLAECEAKRQILDLSQHGCGDDYERVRKALALPYADHPDYRDEWKL